MFRLWAVPLLLPGIALLFGILGTRSTSHLLLGTGMLLSGLFALRHNLLDLSPTGLSPQKIGYGWVALLLASVLLILTAAILSFVR